MHITWACTESAQSLSHFVHLVSHAPLGSSPESRHLSSMFMCVSPWVVSPLLLRPVLPCLLLFLPPPALRATHWARQPDRHAKPALLREQREWPRLRRPHLPHRIIARLHHTDQKQVGWLKRTVRRVKEGTSTVLLQSGLNESWWADSMECYTYLRNVTDLLSDGKTPYEWRFGQPFKGPIIPFGSLVEYHPITAWYCMTRTPMTTSMIAWHCTMRTPMTTWPFTLTSTLSERSAHCSVSSCVLARHISRTRTVAQVMSLSSHPHVHVHVSVSPRLALTFYFTHFLPHSFPFLLHLKFGDNLHTPPKQSMDLSDEFILTTIKEEMQKETVPRNPWPIPTRSKIPYSNDWKIIEMKKCVDDGMLLRMKIIPTIWPHNNASATRTNGGFIQISKVLIPCHWDIVLISSKHCLP